MAPEVRRGSGDYHNGPQRGTHSLAFGSPKSLWEATTEATQLPRPPNLARMLDFRIASQPRPELGPGRQLALRAGVREVSKLWRPVADVPMAGRVGRGLAPAVNLVAGISGARQNAAVCLCMDGKLRAFCEQERVTRVRRVGLPPGGLPAEALETVLRIAGNFTRTDIRTYATGEACVRLPPTRPARLIDHHRAHAATAFHLSGWETAGVLVCDGHSTDHVSVWLGTPGQLTRQDWPASDQGFASVYSEAARLFGFSNGQEHELEALARLDTGAEAERLNGVITYRDGVLRPSAGWQTFVSGWLDRDPSNGLTHRARVASAFQRHLGRLLLQLVQDVAARTAARRICVGGGLFYNTYFTTLLRQAAPLDDAFVAPNPGNAGTAIGAALDAGEGRSHGAVSPFLGPSYDIEEIKRTLDNCKLSAECLSDGEVIDAAVRALTRGELVGWFQGRMEWGHRALGNRSILANPLSPYVLENLNSYLKHRQPYRAYGVSVPEHRSNDFFAGPAASRAMEYEYRPLDPERFRSVLPAGTATIRVQTIPPGGDDGSTERFRLLHDRFGQATGVPVLVNTSFNGFSEPMVCTPRDAIRVFFGTGLDLLVLDRFLIRK
jgi:carbamoyltransferase